MNDYLTVDPTLFLRTLGVRQGDTMRRVYFIYAAAIASLIALFASSLFHMPLLGVSIGISIAATSLLINSTFPWDRRAIVAANPAPSFGDREVRPNLYRPLPQGLSLEELVAAGFPAGTEELSENFTLHEIYQCLDGLLRQTGSMSAKTILLQLPSDINLLLNRGRNSKQNVPLLTALVRHNLELRGYEMPKEPEPPAVKKPEPPAVKKMDGPTVENLAIILRSKHKREEDKLREIEALNPTKALFEEKVAHRSLKKFVEQQGWKQISAYIEALE